MTDETPDLLDPISMARFLVMPGASRLLTAFSEIPPGPLRDSVITHAEVIAATYTAAPPKHRMPDPIRTLASIKGTTALPPPQTITGRPPPPLNEPNLYGGDDRDSQIVQLALSGMKATPIAQELKIAPHVVYAVLAKARAAGVPIAKKGANGPAKKFNKVWYTEFNGDLPAQAQTAIQKAALARGISAQAYLDRRNLAVDMIRAGHRFPAILEATGETDPSIISAWMSHAREAGLDVPFVGAVPLATDAPVPAPEQAPQEAAQEPQEAANVHPMGNPPAKAVDPTRGLIFGVLADYHKSAILTMQKTADARGLTLQAYVALREDIARKRLAGWTVPQIAQAVGQDKQFCRDIIRAAGQRGVEFPSLKEAAA